METLFSSDDSFITGNLDGSVSILIGGELRNTKQFTPLSPMVAYINDEVVVAPSDGTLVILNDDLRIKKQFTNGTRTSKSRKTILSMSASSKFCATADAAGFVRYFRRDFSSLFQHGVPEANV